jgi:hypothetical protein
MLAQIIVGAAQKLPRYRRVVHFVIPILQLAALLGATGFTAAQVNYCPLFNTVVTWVRTLAAILTVLAVLYLGGTKLAASIVPDIGIRTGAVAVGIVFGLILVAFGQDIADAVISAFGLPPVAC